MLLCHRSPSQVGGFAGLKPPLTVVKREPARGADEKILPADQVR